MNDETRYQHGARDPAAREAHRRITRDRRLAIEQAEERTSTAFLVQYSTPNGIIATCHRDLAVVFAGLVGGNSGRRRTGTRTRVRRRIRRDTAN